MVINFHWKNVEKVNVSCLRWYYVVLWKKSMALLYMGSTTKEIWEEPGKLLRINLSSRQIFMSCVVPSTYVLYISLQLKIERDAGRVFKGWNEGRIYFAPTYKYSFNSDAYAGETAKSEKKRRTPAW
jgi:hypothetical protein